MGIDRSDIPATVEGVAMAFGKSAIAGFLGSRKDPADGSGDERVVASSLRERKEPTLQVR